MVEIERFDRANIVSERRTLMNSFPRWMKATLILALLAFLAGGAWYYHKQQQQLRRHAEMALQSIAHLKVDQITNWRRERMGDAALLARTPFLSEAIARWLADPRPDLADQIRTLFRSLQESGPYFDVLLVDPQGRMRLGLESAAGNVPEEVMPSLAAALRDRRPVLSDLHTCATDPAVHISVVAPVFSGNGHDSRPVGAVILVSEAGGFLYRLVQSWPTPSRSAETMLVRRDRENVLVLNDIRFHENAALSLRIPLSRTDVPAVMAVLGAEGLVRGKSLRGVDVMAVTRPIPDSPWFMVAKVDADEALAQLRTESILLLGLLLALVAFAAASVLVIWQRNRKAHYRALYRAEAGRLAAERRYGMTLQSIGDGVIATDAEGLVELLNPVAEGLTGWKRVEACGRPLSEVFCIINEKTRGKVEDPVARVLRDGVVVGLANHTLLIAKDGGERPIADSGAPIRDQEGRITGMVLVFRDQSQERAAEKALRDSEEQYRLLAENVRDVVWLVDIQKNRFLYISPSVFRLRGYTPEEMAAPASDAMTARSRTDMVRRFAEDLELIRDGRYGERPQTVLVEVPCKDGSMVWTEVATNYLYDGSGNPIRIVGLSRDITERKQAEAERLALERRLFQARKAESLGRMAGAIAHHFNNMLAAVLGNLELALLDRPGRSDPRPLIAEAMKASHKAAEISRLMLAYLGQALGKRESADLAEECREALSRIKESLPDGARLTMHLPDSGPFVRADASQIGQVLTNLVVNAGESLEERQGEITVSLSSVSAAEIRASRFFPEDWEPTAEEYACLSVEDTGCGLSQETLENLFDPFFSTKFTGRGLGLAVAIGIVKAHDGAMTVDNREGTGARFAVYLPRAPGEQVEPQTSEGPLEGEPLEGRGLVLVVDDEPMVRNMARDMLASLGLETITAANGTEALEVFRRMGKNIFCVLLDLTMPGMNGCEVLGALRQIQPGLPVILASGFDEARVMEGDHPEWPQAFLGKPYRMNDLKAALNRAVKGSV